ncbi:unnamed protein product [Lathyrus sativus]|nr:unnamed protein product [Lathyrus sativus]
MIRDIGVDAFKKVNVVDTLQRDMKESLYLGCKSFTRLSAMLRLFHLKGKCGWTDRSFIELLEILKEMLQEGNISPNCSYKTKKILCPMGLNYVKTHACLNGCILYRKEYEKLKECPRCGESRYKQKENGVKDDDNVTRKGVPSKVMWYLLVRCWIEL